MNPIIRIAELEALLVAPRLLDCRFDLVDPAAGEREHALGHPEGAVYASLDRDLSGPKTGLTGRHPLPSREAFAATLGAWGIEPATTVVAFDDQGGPYAARAWWLLRWMGHARVAVLDGGLAALKAAGRPMSTTPTTVSPVAPYPASHVPGMPTIDAAALLASLGQAKVLDARAGERFRGEVEPLDRVAGHIPGAHHRFYKDNLQADGRFKPADQLRGEFARLGGAPDQWVQQCGSGVTACHNLLAMTHAGLEGSKLYPGSWSEWSSDPTRPVARG